MSAWWLGLAALWVGAFVVPLVLLLMPRGGMVPEQGRAWQLAFALALVAIGASFAWPIGSALPDGHIFMRAGRNCFGLGLAIAIVPALAALVALRGVVQVGRWRLGAALGA